MARYAKLKVKIEIHSQISHSCGKDRNKKEEVPSISYFTLYRFASKKDRVFIAISLFASFVAGAIVPYAITLVATTFQHMISYTMGKESSEYFLSKIHFFGVVYFCYGLVSFVGAYFGSALMNATANNQVHKIRQAYLRAALNQDIAYYDERSSGGFASRMAEDVIKVGEGIGDKVAACVYSLTVALGCIAMTLLKGWRLALLCLTSTPVTLLVVGLIGLMTVKLSQKQAMAASGASDVAQEVLASIRTVYSFNAQQRELERYKTPLAEERRINIKRQLIFGVLMGVSLFFVFCSYALFFYLGVYLIVNDPANYDASVMFSVFFGTLSAMNNMVVVASLISSFGAAKGAGAYIFYLIDQLPSINPLLKRGIKLSDAKGNIELKDVMFHYLSRPSVQVLKGVNMTIKHGQSVALVGHSGCGKSTVIHLIARFYDVTNGSVTIDGHDVRKLSVNWLRASIGMVSQEPVLFLVSIRENIRYGKEDASDEEIVAAAKLANAHNFIMKLPKGYDTKVGDRGSSLSGGQKQRIAIARALVREPLILLLDEATSALDPKSEAQVQIALEKAAKGRTTIVVAHRLSTIRNVDVIYTMKDGAITESGSHNELIAKKGTYYEMVNTQESVGTSRELQDHEYSTTQSEISEEEYHEQEVNFVSNAGMDTKAPKISFWRVMRLNSPEWKYISIGSIGTLITSFATPVFIIAFGDIFGSMSNPDPNNLWERVKKVTVILVLLGLILGVFNFVQGGTFGIAGAYLTERLRVRMFAHMLRQHIAFFDEDANSTGALCAKLSAEPAYVKGATGECIVILLQAIGSIVLALFVSMVCEWRVGLVVLAFCPVVITVMYYQAKATRRESCGNAQALESSTKIAVEAVSNIRTVASLGREEWFLKEYMAQLELGLPMARRSAHYRGLVAGISKSVFAFINSVAITYGGHLIVNDGVLYQNILVTTQSLTVTTDIVQHALSYAPDFQKGVDAASRIVAFLATKPKIVDPESPSVVNFVSNGAATLKGVEFKYPTRPNVSVLNGLDMDVESGKTIALVGRNGSGKSTVVQLLQRFYDPNYGTVYLDGHPLPNLIIPEVRSAFGMVSQEPVLFRGTVSENIAYGAPRVTHDAVVEAARQANIHDFIQQLPAGYDSEIGAKGVQLSVGQKQRIAIARALLRDPKILLLDEATSALDNESEKIVTEALSRARAGRTCVVVAHRVSATRDADRVCVLRGGTVVASGTHEQLQQMNGEYEQLYGARDK